ncbi:MAG: hypothetical protein Q6351_005865 [Candidatus Njordarchaeum guaymaensis]
MPKIVLKLKYKTLRGLKLVWNFYNDIPPLRIVASPLDKNWPDRVKEEISVFNLWRKFNPKVPFSDLRIHDNPRRFIIDANLHELFMKGNKDLWQSISILIPLRYPFQMPILGDPARDKAFIKLLRGWTDNRPFCMPQVFHIWWNRLSGGAGIAHFLHAYLVFLSIAGKKAVKREYIYSLDFFKI